MLTQSVTDCRAWKREAMNSSPSWYVPLSPRCQTALDQAVAELRRWPLPPTELRAAGEPWTACAAELQPVLHELETGRGFVILRGIPRAYSSQEWQAVYWLAGQLLGRPFVQNVQGTLLYDVKDTGQDVRYGARFSVTNAESTFHTDNSFGDEILDYVGLLCLNTAKSGGLSQLVSAYAVHNRLLADHKDVLEMLYQPFQVDRRGGLRPGEAPTVPVPIFSWDGRQLLCRYLRYWIEVGQEKAGTPLTPDQAHALDILDHVAADPDLRVEFPLAPGDMFFINNRWTLHNRTAFEDYSQPERKRHLVRLWLRKA